MGRLNNLFMFAIVRFVKITCVYQAIASLSTIVTSTELLGRVMLTSLQLYIKLIKVKINKAINAITGKIIKLHNYTYKIMKDILKVDLKELFMTYMPSYSSSNPKLQLHTSPGKMMLITR